MESIQSLSILCGFCVEYQGECKVLSTGNHTRVDNFFCSKDPLDTVTKCHTDNATHWIKTDHYPIVTTLDIHTPKANQPPRLNFCKMNWPKFILTLKSNFKNLPQPAPINNINTFNHKLTALNAAIWNAIDTHFEASKPLPYSKRWWSNNLAQDKKTTTKLVLQFLPPCCFTSLFHFLFHYHSLLSFYISVSLPCWLLMLFLFLLYLHHHVQPWWLHALPIMTHR